MSEKVIGYWLDKKTRENVCAVERIEESIIKTKRHISWKNTVSPQLITHTHKDMQTQILYN